MHKILKLEGEDRNEVDETLGYSCVKMQTFKCDTNCNSIISWNQNLVSPSFNMKKHKQAMYKVE